MTIVRTEGFDKYGIAGSFGAAPASNAMENNLIAAMQQLGQWSTVSVDTIGHLQIVAPLSGGGAAMSFQAGGSANTFAQWALDAAASKARGGFRFQIPGFTGITQRRFLWATNTSAQTNFGICITSSGNIAITNGSGTVATSTAAITAGSKHYLEWDVDVSTTSGAYNVYLDGNATPILTGTGNFKAAAGTTYNNLYFGWSDGLGGGLTIILDDMYVDDGTGSVLLTNPVIETHAESADSSVQFAATAGVLGAYLNNVGTSNAPGANELFLRKFTAPAGGCTITAVSCYPGATSAGAKFKAVVYSDSAGVPGTLLGSASVDTTGSTINVALTSTLGSSVALTAATAYWLGFITDTSVVLFQSDSGTTGSKAANTYTSGAPGTAPGMTTGQGSWMIWGSVTGITTNTGVLNNVPSPNYLGDFSYTSDSTVGHEDLFSFPALTYSPTAIHAVSLHVSLKTTDGGVRTMTLNTKSSTTDSTGSKAAFTPSSSYQGYTSLWLVDPNTSSAWTAANLNSALGGYKIAS